ncbi:MAG: hypothetical protein AAF533_06735 [Acidobacteriota bacterium]
MRFRSISCPWIGLLLVLALRAEPLWAGCDESAPLVQHSAFIACECGTPEGGAPDMETGALYAFRVRPDLEGEPDLLFDRWRLGATQIPGVSHTGGSFYHYEAAAFREELLSDDRFVNLHVDRGMLWISSREEFEGGAVPVAQPVGAYPGHLAPLLEAGAPHPRLLWAPVNEFGHSDAEICRPEFPGVKGFVIGYNVYRLSMAAHPSPGLRDFLVHGTHRHVDVLALDFDVPDLDGTEGSDLDPADGLTLINPDGLPDTGDEILVFEDRDVMSPAGWWYRVQPVVRGDQGFFDEGLTSCSGLPAERLDLDGDGLPESVDIDPTGLFVEFIDPSGRGLGLTHEGEILSSFLPASWMPALGTHDCETNSVEPAQETDCGDGLDDDQDGNTDCDDSDCEGVPPCVPTGVDIGSPGSGRVLIGWDETDSFGPVDLLLGDLDVLVSTGDYNHGRHRCGLSGGRVEIPMPPGNVYFVVSAPVGPAGADSSGRPRPPAPEGCR